MGLRPVVERLLYETNRGHKAIGAYLRNRAQRWVYCKSKQQKHAPLRQILLKLPP